MSLEEAKRRLRATAIAARRSAHADGEPAARRHCARLLEALGPELEARPGAVITGYWPIRDELDIRPLLGELARRGFACALPVVTDRARPLVFRRWAPGDPLSPGPLGTRQPGGDAEELTPDILLVPLLAADATGRRLGYGAGYYDRTLRALRRRRPVLAVGVAYDAQIVDAVPNGPRDERLDWIVTERRTIRCDLRTAGG